ncbi:hypothetical protein, partial [Herbiconiux daphne]
TTKNRLNSISSMLDVLIEEEEEAVQAITQDGTIIGKKEWESNGALNTCANCSSPILWDDAENTTIIDGNSFCEDCASKLNENDEEGYGYPKDGGSELNTSANIASTYHFKCSKCGYLQHKDLESNVDGVCVMCKNSEPLPVPNKILKIRSTLKNGMRVTRSQWNQMNKCVSCKRSVEWDDAENTEFTDGSNGSIICSDCDKNLKENKLSARTKRLIR